MENKILVTCIMPVYNRENIVIRSLNSLYEQPYRPLEIIIINDGSTDNSEEIILKWKAEYESEEFSVRYIRQDNSGAPHARNVGVNLSTGEFIQYIDSDDIISKNKISKQVAAIKTMDLDIVYCDFIIENENGDIIKRVRNDGNVLLRISMGWSVSIFTPLIRRELLVNIIYWNTNLTQKQDKEYMLKAFLLSNNNLYTPEFMCVYTMHNDFQISDLYATKSPEYMKVFKSILKFVLKNIKIIPRKNLIYAIISLIMLPYQWLKYTLNKTYKKVFTSKLD